MLLLESEDAAVLEEQSAMMSARQRLAIITVPTVASLLAVNRHVGHRWGATAEEARMSLPGDDVIRSPIWQTTHGIAIHAPESDIWPWIIQMGITRGGWYLSRRLDRVVWRIDNPSVDRIIPELQDLLAGNCVPDSVDGTAHFLVIEVAPPRALVLHSRRHPLTGIWPDLTSEHPGCYLDFSWAFVLRDMGAGTTRLLMRSRAVVMSGHSRAPAWVSVGLPVVDLADFIYTRQMLRGIRRRVERSAPNRQTCTVTH